MSQVTYRSEDGTSFFQFDVRRRPDNSLRAYVTDMPSYGSRDTGLHPTHRHYENGRHFVCWDRPLYEETQLQKVMKVWSENTLAYIRTGKRF